MADVFTKAKRSEVMARIHSKGNRDTELRMIKIFREYNITGWRRNAPLIGKPDFVFPKMRLALFVDGCFWHGCPVHFRTPKSRKKYWSEKIARNKHRDRQVASALRKNGWRVVRIWEHALTVKRSRATANRLKKLIGLMHS